MAVVLVVAVAAFVGALIGGFVAWRLPDFDPAAPRVGGHAIAEEVEEHPRTASFLNSRLNPSAATGLALTVALGIAVLGAVAIGSLFIMVQHNAGLARYDLSAARWGGDHATSGSTHILKQISLLGGTPVMIAVALVAAIAAVRAQPNRRRVLVHGAGRRRPGRAHEPHQGDRRSAPTPHSPTHGFLGRLVPVRPCRDRGRDVRRGCTPHGPRPFATNEGDPRGCDRSDRVRGRDNACLLGVHWMTDVIAGLAMGWGWFAICSIAFGGRLLAFGQPVKVAERIEASTGVT